MLAVKDIAQISHAEHLDATERLWESFARDGVDYPSPDWHHGVLEERSKQADSDTAVWLSVNELQARLHST